jgi:hypothetical protein
VCIGVEYEGTSMQQVRWRKLIADVRAVYKGYVTYAATFMEWKKVPWWDAVDCIGIDAYFPLTDRAMAGDDELRAGWTKVYAELEPLAHKIGKPICFTEIGYSDSSLAGKEPWSYTIVDSSVEYQARLYKVAIEEAAKRDFVAGLFIWKWFTSDDFRRLEGRDPFVMQDREPVLAVLRQAWNPSAPPVSK